MRLGSVYHVGAVHALGAVYLLSRLQLAPLLQLGERRSKCEVTRGPEPPREGGEAGGGGQARGQCLAVQRGLAASEPTA